MRARVVAVVLAALVAGRHLTAQEPPTLEYGSVVRLHSISLNEDRRLNVYLPRFVDFLETELVPYVTSHYRTNPMRTLIGQSLGGLLATQILLQTPRLFSQYVIVSPSLWWNREALLKEAQTDLSRNRVADLKVYLSVADEPSEMQDAAERLAQIIRTTRPDIACFYEYLPSETHATSLHISLYNAMHLLNKKS